MATSLMGPQFVDSALPAAPVPRPPQPTRATWIRSVPAAWTGGMAMPARAVVPAPWTGGMATPAKADAAARRPVFCNNSRREETGRFASLIFGLRFWGACSEVGSAGPQGDRREDRAGSPGETISDI